MSPEEFFPNLPQHQTKHLYEKFHKTARPSKKFDLLAMFLKLYGMKVVGLGMLFALIFVLIDCVESVMLDKFLTLLKKSSIIPNEVYLYMLGYVLCSFLDIICFHPFFYYICEIGVKLRSGCYALVYKKVNCVISVTHSRCNVPLIPGNFPSKRLEQRRH